MALSKRDYEEFKGSVEKLVHKYVSRERSNITSIIVHAYDSGQNKRHLEDKLMNYVDRTLAYKLADKSNMYLEETLAKADKKEKKDDKSSRKRSHYDEKDREKDSKRARTKDDHENDVSSKELSEDRTGSAACTESPGQMQAQQIKDIMAKAQAVIEERKKAMSIPPSTNGAGVGPGMMLPTSGGLGPPGGGMAPIGLPTVGAPNSSSVTSRIAQLQARIQAQVGSIAIPSLAMPMMDPNPPIDMAQVTAEVQSKVRDMEIFPGSDNPTEAFLEISEEKEPRKKAGVQYGTKMESDQTVGEKPSKTPTENFTLPTAVLTYEDDEADISEPSNKDSDIIIEDEELSNFKLIFEVTKIGLDDANYWIPILKKYFGVRSELGLQCLGPDSYLMINQFSRNMNETVIIKKMCNVPHENNYVKWQENMKEKMDLRLAKLKLLYNELEKMKKSNLVSDDLIDQKMYNYLEIMQKNQCGLHKDQETDNVFNMIYEEVETTIKYLDEYKTESIKNIEKGKIKELVSQCFGGILISESLSDQYKQRKCILDVPEEIIFQPPIIPEIIETNISITMDDQICFKSCLENLGYSITTLIDSKGFYGYNSDRESLKLSEKNIFPVSATDYVIVPVSSCMFDFKSFKFCSDALSKLKALEYILLQPKSRAAAIQKSCEELFSLYGSHVNFGKIHFGGIFMSDRKPYENEKCFNGRKYNSNNELENNVADLSQFETGRNNLAPLNITVIGGCEKESIFRSWRHSLKTNMKFWKVVDRGCNLIPIWEILKLNHATEFENVNLLSDCLCQGWERFVKIESNIPLFVNTQDIEKEVSCILSQLELWTSDEYQISNCENNLSLLMQLKEDLHLRTKDPLAFARTILTHPNMHRYMKGLNALSENIPVKESRNVHYLMRHIISDSYYAGIDLSMKNSDDTLSDNICIIENFEEYLKKVCQLQNQFPEDKSNFIPVSMKGIINSVKNLSCTLRYIFSELSRHGKIYEELLLMLILMPLEYSYECKLFSHWYHDNAIQHVIDYMKYFGKLSVYKTEVEIQAFLLHLGLSFANRQSDKRKLVLDSFRCYLQDKLHPHIIQLLECHEDFEKLNIELSNVFSRINYQGEFIEKKNNGKKFENAFDLELDQFEQNSMNLIINNDLKNGNGKFESVLRDLCLEEVLLFKFGMKDILTVTRTSLKWEEQQTLKQNILYIISKQVMLDYRSRNVQLTIPNNHFDESSMPVDFDKQKPELKNPENEIAMGVEENNDLESVLMELMEESQIDTPNLLHPLDVTVILMNCCDNILRQIIVQKMAVCQLAIPLVLPDLHSPEPLFLLWAMRLLNMKWKTQSKEAQDVTPVSHPTPIVSAIRLGDLSRSKSKILNEIICNQPHDIFFHRDCKAGNFPRKLSNGMVELAWYLPGGKKEDHFNNILALANLRDDAKNHSKEVDMISKISTVILVFLSFQSISNPEYSDMLKKLSVSNSDLVFIFVDTVNHISNENQIQILKDTKRLMGNKKFKTILGSVKGQVKNAVMLSAELRNHINVYLKSSCENEGITDLLNWETVSNIARSLGIKVDEDSQSCENGKKMADIIISELQSKNITTIKEQVLPLQGHLWSEWSRLSKMQARMDGVMGKDQEAFISEIHKKKKRCRQEQYNLVEKMTPTMKKFIQTLLFTKDNPDFRISFMQWMKLSLDAISHKKLPELQMKYHSLWNDIQEQKIKKLNEILIRGIQSKLEEVERDLIATSFGLEHFMREIGQIYEAFVDHKDVKCEQFKSLHLLPQFAADLLISGFPLEIMDGDACHMPLTWVKAVFDSLRNGLGDKKLYVISVLGVQSSGKSTLLNTMFGLNFAVSAGRCTKGVYAQLIPVESSLIEELGYDYILVLDTEGLRAPELGTSKLNHDNELAALVIGMGDVTILNIKGENTAEIEDILQISVHAFLRMRLVKKNVKLQPGCYFVHQNVPAVNATEKMLYGYKKLQEQLDAMTIAAAEEENSSDIQSFRDVIEFDVKNNVWYFSSLWQGDPPMAPANPSYSERILDLKTNLLKYPSQKKINCSSFTDLQLRMSDLWNAILYENFVFSFKNSIEVKSYSNLEEKFAQVSWKFRNEVKKWINGSINEIQSCKENNITSLHGSVISSLLTCIEENFSKCKTELDNFFASARDKDILVQWKSNIELKLRSLSDELKIEAKKNCERHLDMRAAQFAQEKRTDSYEKHLQLFVKELVSTNVEEKMSEEELNKKFDEKWNDWIKILDIEQMEQEKDVMGDVLTILTQYFKKDGRILQMVMSQYKSLEMKNGNLDILPYVNDEDYSPKSSCRKFFRYYTQVLTNSMDAVITIQNFTRGLLNSLKHYFKEKKDQDYDYAFIYYICNFVKEQIKMFNSEDRCYALQKNYSIKLTVHILMNVIPLFQEMHREYRDKNDPIRILEVDYKPQLQKLFHGNYSQCMQENTAANILSTSLEKAILVSLKRDLPRKIAENYSTSHSECHTKLKLYAKIMEDLGTKKSFEMYLKFINDPNTSMENWLKVYVYNYCSNINDNGISNLGNAANEILRNTVSTLVNYVKEVKLSLNTNSLSFQSWVQKYLGMAKRIISISDTLFNILDTQQVKNIEYFEEMIILGLNNIQENLEHFFSTWSIGELDGLDENPHLLISKNILGCTKQCPFCKTICINTIGDHSGSSHSAPLHHPQGIAGYKDDNTREMVLNSCNIDVAGDRGFRCHDTWKEWYKYKEYKTVNDYYASWSISPDTSLEASTYWKWVFVQFSEEFAEYHRGFCPEIPSSWYEISWDDAKNSIRNSCYI